MFCKNCGSEISNGDRFCGTCGQPQFESGSIPRGTFTQGRVMDTGLVKLIKNYFIKPVSFFSELKGENSLKTSISLFIGLPIIYGLLNIIYTSALVNSFFSMLKKLPEVLANAKIVPQQEAARLSQELAMSNELLEAKSRINSMIDNKDVFLHSFIQLLVIIILSAIILAILNAVMLKNKIKHEDILFLAVSSYIPLVIAAAITSIATLVSITFGLLILFSGYILSFITLYSGIKQISEEKNDKVFVIMIIFFVVCSALLSIFIVKQIESSLVSTMQLLDPVKKFF